MTTTAAHLAPTALSQRWLLLAALSLTLSALAACALVLARTPVLTGWVPHDLFPRALVVHVNLATTVWYLSMACAFWTERTLPARRPLLAAAQGLSLMGAGGVMVVGFSAAGDPVLANYVPYLDSSLFVVALACFATGITGTALFSLQRPADAAGWGFAIARFPVLMGGLYLALAPPLSLSMTDAVWGAGHILQFGYVTLLMAIWWRLAEQGGAKLPSPTVAAACFATAALPAVIGPVAALVLDGIALQPFHTTLMRWANWPVALAVGILLALREQPSHFASPLRGSLLLFVTGCLAGLAIDSQTTMIPAHYHGTIGAFTLVLMAAVFARARPAADAAQPLRGAPAWSLRFYFAGIALLIGGLAWSGALGSPRKTPFHGEGDLGQLLAASLTGLGGAVTIAGVLLMGLFAIPRIWRLCRHTPRNPNSASASAFGAMFASGRSQ